LGLECNAIIYKYFVFEEVLKSSLLGVPNQQIYPLLNSRRFADDAVNIDFEDYIGPIGISIQTRLIEQ
jgi:hypothetical protein